jgi:hypothetical protein
MRYEGCMWAKCVFFRGDGVLTKADNAIATQFSSSKNEIEILFEGESLAKYCAGRAYGVLVTASH